MPATFEFAGIRMQYPESWSLEQGEHDNGWSITVQSRDTAFLSLSVHEDTEEIGSLVDSVIDTFRQEYPGLEADSALETIGGQPAIGYDIRFFTLDLTNTAWVRGLACEGGCVLLIAQLNDLELDTNGQVLRAIIQSIQVDD